MEITQETVRDLGHGWVAVGNSSPTLVCAIDRLAYKGVLVVCPGPGDVDANTGATANTVPVYVGGPGVESAQTTAGGIPVAPGRSFVIPIERPGQVIWAKASITGQKLGWMLI